MEKQLPHTAQVAGIRGDTLRGAPHKRGSQLNPRESVATL